MDGKAFGYSSMETEGMKSVNFLSAIQNEY